MCIDEAKPFFEYAPTFKVWVDRKYFVELIALITAMASVFMAVAILHFVLTKVRHLSNKTYFIFQSVVELFILPLILVALCFQLHGINLGQKLYTDKLDSKGEYCEAVKQIRRFGYVMFLVISLVAFQIMHFVIKYWALS